jgi:hypothetical protein
VTRPASRRIVLHIGAPKCGSTYLQRVMLRNTATLEAAGIRYPHDGQSHPGNAASLGAIDRATLERHFSGGIHTVIFSHEDLFPNAQRGAALARLAAEDGTTVQIVVFLRPFSEMIFGDYSQFMKQFFDRYLASRDPYDGRDFEAFVLERARVLTPAAFLTRWQAIVPAPPLILDRHRRIRAVLEGLLGEGVVLDWRVPPSETNPSLRMEDCDRLAAAMRDPTIADDDIRAMFKAAFHRKGDPDGGRSAARVAWVEARFAGETGALLKRFGFDNRPPEVTGIA